MTRLQLALATLIVVSPPALDVGPTARGQLDPNAFPTLGTLNVSSGTLTIDTDALTVSGAASFTGVALNQIGGPQVAVFDFSSITIGSAVTVTLQGTRPLALLSRSNATIQSTLTVSAGASNPNSNTSNLGGYAGGAVLLSSNSGTGIVATAGEGPGGGGATVGGTSGAAGGGGYGGVGGLTPSGLGGLAYGNLFQTLQGGSGGGAVASSGGGTSTSANAIGGGGGGSLEVVAAGTLAIASVSAVGYGGSGSDSGSSPYHVYQAGGGAGGGILLSGKTGLTLSAPLDVHGGADANSGLGNTGGGGGGRIALAGLSTYTIGSSTISGGQFFAYNANGGTGNFGGFAGVVTVDALSTTIPSGTSVTLNGNSFLSVAGSTNQTGATVEAYARHDVIVNGSAVLAATNAFQKLDASGNNVTSLTLNGALNLNGFSETVDNFAGSSGSALLSLPAGSTLTVGVNGSGGNYPGQLSGPGSFVKVGSGVLNLSAASPNFTGQTTVTGGQLVVGDLTLQNSTVVASQSGFVFGLVFANGDVNPVLGALAGTTDFYLVGGNLNSLTVGGNNASTTYAGDFIAGSLPGGLIKAGTGVWTLAGGNNLSGPFNIQGGTVLVASGAVLSPNAPITLSAGATLDLNGYGYTVTSANALAVQGNLRLGGAGLTVASGATATYNGAYVSNGFLSGSGTQTVTGGATLSGITTLNSAVIAQTGAGTLTNFTNGGTLTVAGGLSTGVTFNGFTNQGSGSITVGAGSQVNAADFETYGTLTLSPGSTAAPTQLANTGGSNLYFNGGSRTFISLPSHANPNQFDAGIDLHGQNAVVAGGLFVNNGYVVDSTNAVPPVTVIADFGSLIKGAGFFQNSVQTINGGKFQSGNSPGQASFGSFTFGPGGVTNYVFAIDDATGTAGPSPDANGQVSGWGLVNTVQRLVGGTTTTGDFAWTATPANKLTVSLDTLINPTTVGTDVAGPMADFDPTRPYSWLAASWMGNYSGPTDPATLDTATAFDTSGFTNPIAGTFSWSLDSGGHSLSLIYTPSAVPEPRTMVLTGIASFGLCMWNRRPSRLRCMLRD